jgi:hypothetical protein
MVRNKIVALITLVSFLSFNCYTIKNERADYLATAQDRIERSNNYA